MAHLNKGIAFLSIFFLSALLGLSCNSGPVDQTGQRDPVINAQTSLAGVEPFSDLPVLETFQISDPPVTMTLQITDVEFKVPTTEVTPVTLNVGEPEQPKGFLSKKERNTSPDVTKEELRETSSSLITTSVDLYHYTSGNTVLSPYALSRAMARLYLGAEATVQEKISEAFHWSLPKDRLHLIFNALDLTLSDRLTKHTGEGENSWMASVAWGQIGYGYTLTFIDSLAENYGLILSPLDFNESYPDAEKQVTEWTNQVIEGNDLDLPYYIDASRDTRLVFTDAAHFSPAWAIPFDPSETRSDWFHLLDDSNWYSSHDGGSVQVEMMHTNGTFGYYRGDSYDALDVPFQGEELAVLLIIPDCGAFREFEASLNTTILDKIISNLLPTPVELDLVKFSLTSNLDLMEILDEMDIARFLGKGSGGLSEIDGTFDLYLAGFKQGTALSFDERGLTMSNQTFLTIDDEIPATWSNYSGSVSAVFRIRTGVEPTEMVDAIPVKLGRPFLFIIHDVETWSILFFGRVLNPHPESKIYYEWGANPSTSCLGG